MVRRGRLLDPGRAARMALSKSRGQEDRTAAQTGGKRTPGSGNQWFSKGDVHTKSACIENKRTDSGRYILKAVELRRYRLQAIKEGKRFIMQVDLSDDPRDRYVVVPLEDYDLEK